MKQRELTDWDRAVNAASRMCTALAIARAAGDRNKQLVAAKRAYMHLRDLLQVMGVRSDDPLVGEAITDPGLLWEDR